MMELSIAEQKLISFTREEFGELLTRFLLAGLGEVDAGQKWQFTISYTSTKDNPLERRVQVLSYEPGDGQSYLPRSRDPLVLLALLRLLMGGGQASEHCLLYSQGDVLNLLGWGDIQEARDEIDGALERYSLITFKWEMNSTELIDNNLSHYAATGCLISEYETFDEGKVKDGQVSRVHNRVTFNPDFVERLKYRSLFGIDWGKVQSLNQKTASSGLKD